MKSNVNPRQIELLDAEMAAVLRAKSPADRLAIAFDCNRTARLMIAGHLRSKRPDWSEAEVEAEVARRMLLGTN